MLRRVEARVLPHGWRDLWVQIGVFLGCYGAYQVVRGVVATHDADPSGRAFSDATRIIDLERALHVFSEPQIQAWAAGHPLLMNVLDVVYLDAHLLVTLGALVFVYLRRNRAFPFVRNMFVIAMALALVGYAAYPTAPPRLMPGWGFTDSIRQFTGVSLEHGVGSVLVNLYAAVPSMHVCFAVMLGFTMTRLVRNPAARVAWLGYPLVVGLAVIATGNHYLTDVVLGGATAGAAAIAAAHREPLATPELGGVVA